MKKLLILLAFSFFLITSARHNALAQSTHYVFTYDTSGNRTSRTIDLSKSAEISASSSIANNEKLLEAELANLEIKIYPNPTKGILKIEIPSIGEIKPSLVVYNLSGEQLVHKTVASQISTIDLSGQPAGMYILKIINGQESLDWKIIKD